LIQAASTLPAISYAVPGTVLAIGLLIPLAGLDNGIDGLMRWLFELSTGLLLSGTAFAIVRLHDPFSRGLTQRDRGRFKQDFPKH